MQELKVRELDVSYCNLPTSIITSLLTRATTLEVRTPVLVDLAFLVQPLRPKLLFYDCAPELPTCR